MAQTARFSIEPTRDADQIIQAALPGLSDVEQWVSSEKLVFFLAQEIFIAFLAYSNPRVSQLPIGVIMGGLEDEGRVWIELLSVHPAYRRFGVATALVEALKTKADAIQARGLMVDVDDDNTAAQKFYRQLGFRKVGQIKQYYYDASTALIFFCPT